MAAIPQAADHIVFDTKSLSDFNLSSKVCWVRKPQGYACLQLPNTGIPSFKPPHLLYLFSFNVGSRNQTQVFVLGKQVLID